jgi:hypothetical protein
MERVGRRMRNKDLRKLLGKFLRAGVMVDGRLQPTRVGVPQKSFYNFYVFTICNVSEALFVYL